jgi:hypothetical protein
MYAFVFNNIDFVLDVQVFPIYGYVLFAKVS